MKALKSSKRLSGSNSTGNLDQHRKSNRSSNATAKVLKEKQGPIDWSIRGLKCKYRGEKEREDAWNLWLSASKYAEKSLSEHDFIIPTVKVERHPFYVSYYKHLLDENVQSSSRSKARLLQKRFVFDVQEIWLTNLEHLREHKPEHMGNEGGPEADRPENAHRGNGLQNRRDVRAIEALESQVQSVSQKRAFANAYHTARLPNIQVVLDYEPRPTPRLQNINCLPPTVESLIRDVRLKPGVGDSAPILFASETFPQLVYVLHIDRLLPSTDFIHCGAMTEVMWRLSVHRNDDSSLVQYYLCREQEVAEYAAQLIMNRTAQESQHTATSAGATLASPLQLLCSGLVYSGANTVCVPCIVAGAATTDEAFARVSVALLGMGRGQAQAAQHLDVPQFEYFDCVTQPELLEQRLHLLHSVKVEICVAVLTTTAAGRETDRDGEEQKVFLECSLAELRFALRDLPAAAAAPLGGPQALLYWLSPERVTDTWPQLALHLAVEKTSSEVGDTYTAHLTQTLEQRRARSALSSATGLVLPEQVEGALSSLEALSCAAELLDALRLVELPTDAGASGSGDHHSRAIHALHLEGSGQGFFERVEFTQLQGNHAHHEAGLGILESHMAIGGVEMAHQMAAPLLYFDNNALRSHSGDGDGGGDACTPSRPRTGSPGSPLHLQPSHERLGARAAYFQRIMAPIPGEVLGRIRTGHWERAQDTACNLSLLASGALPTVTQVPGACEYGRKGIWFADHNTAPVEYTQAAARFFREQRATSTHSVLVNMTFALDTSLLFDPLTAWEDFSSYPPPAPAEEVDGTVPAVTVPPAALLSEALLSPLEQRVSDTVMVFTTLPVEGVDFMPLDTPTMPKGFRRHVSTKNRYGFREQVEVTLLGVDPVLATVVFGITRTGAVPNNTGVNNRNLWHNTLAVTEHINRPRAPKDYHYVLVKGEHNGANEPTRYTTRMRGDKMVGLTSSAFSTYEDNYAAIQELRDIFSKQVALDAKIEKVENDIIIKQKLLKIHFQNQLQRGIEKKMRKATKSELGWRARFKMSTLIELQGNWERRRDDRTGMFFFRNLMEGEQAGSLGQEEQFLQSCQWEVPPAWDGDPLSNDVGGGKERARFLYSGHQQARRPGAPHKSSASASFGSLSAADLMSELRDDELDPFDLAPARWEPHPAPQHPAAHRAPPKETAQGTMLSATKGAFDQPPDTWMPPLSASAGLESGGYPFHGGSGSVGSVRTNSIGRPPRAVPSVRSAASELNSVQADRSLAESAAATIDTANLEHIAEQLVSSDELMRVIARRLGIPESQVVPADELSSVFSVSSAGQGSVASGMVDDRQNPLHAPRDPWSDSLDEPEFDSDDDLWSDDGHAVGDFDDEKEIGAPEDMPQTQLEAAQMRRRELRELRGNRQETPSVPSHIPALDLRHLKNPRRSGEDNMKDDVDAEAAREEVFGWRRLPRPIIRPGFLSDALLTHTKPPDATSSNTLNSPVFLMPISPVDACKYYPEEFTTAIESIFVPDAKKDMERSIATVERNIRREEELTRNLPTDDLLLFGEATEFTSTDAFLARQRKEDLDQVRDPAEEAREKSILAAKSGNMAMMEDSLAMDADVNTTDDFGNTLLILAAQQGNKRMCKFLLRKGANINKQSIAGNTALHYCYAYGNAALGEYLKTKGADDSIVNVDKLTCYEGLSMDAMKEFYGDDEEAHMIMPRTGGDSDSDDERL